jgi:hypothetical protein
MKLLKFLIGCVIFVIAFSIVAAAYERIEGGPWYTYVNASGSRVVIGQDVRTSYDVYDEDGNLVDTAPAWKFENEASNSYIRNKDGKLRLKEPVPLPRWMGITNAVLQPFLKLGHFVVDHVVDFFAKLK